MLLIFMISKLMRKFIPQQMNNLDWIFKMYISHVLHQNKVQWISCKFLEILIDLCQNTLIICILRHFLKKLRIPNSLIQQEFNKYQIQYKHMDLDLLIQLLISFISLFKRNLKLSPDFCLTSLFNHHFKRNSVISVVTANILMNVQNNSTVKYKDWDSMNLGILILINLENQ